MKYQLRLGVAALTLLAGAGIAIAADSGSTSRDHLNLTNAQQKEIWQSVSKQNARETAPAGFKAMVGEVVPTSIGLHALPSDATRQVPAVKSYDFAILQDQILLVDPTSKKIADIIRE